MLAYPLIQKLQSADQLIFRGCTKTVCSRIFKDKLRHQSFFKKLREKENLERSVVLGFVNILKCLIIIQLQPERYHHTSY